MPKRKIISQEAVEEILRFVENDDLSDDDFDNDSGDDLHELYDADDINAAQEDSEDDSSPENDVAVEVNRPPRKCLTRTRLVNSIDKAPDPSCFEAHDFGCTDDD